MNKKKKTNRFSYIFLALTLALYLFVAFTSPDKAILALDKSMQILRQVVPILVIVLLLTALMNILIKPQTISKYLGNSSGIKGWFIALFGGVISHGSSYIWYPVLQDFRSHGARNGLIIAFLYARAIKLPWLPMMISYFGWGFTLVLTVYILIGAFIQGLISDGLLSRDEALAQEDN
jgi:uncharacterized membrane protein YraQ (UPF0718 family)